MDLSSISALICGDPIPDITDDLNTGSLLDRADLTLDQQQELDQLEGQLYFGNIMVVYNFHHEMIHSVKVTDHTFSLSIFI